MATSATSTTSTTSLSQSSGAELLARAIIAQAREEAEKIQATAKAEAEVLIAEAEAEAAQRHKVVTEEGKARALKEKTKALATAELEARRLFLRAREELSEQVFSRTAEAFTALAEQPAYPDLLLRLIQEGVASLVGEAFIAEVAPKDLSLAQHVLLSAPLAGKRVEVQATEEVGGGCLVWQQDRRACYDNSFAGILARHKEQLRPLIATWLLETEKYGQG